MAPPLVKCYSFSTGSRFVFNSVCDDSGWELIPANLALVRRRANTWHSCWVDRCVSMVHDITALHWLHAAEFSSCLVKCSRALDRLLSTMLPRTWRSESSQRVWRKRTAMQNFRKKQKTLCREMREPLKRINNSDRIGPLEPVLSWNLSSVPTPSDDSWFVGATRC